MGGPRERIRRAAASDLDLADIDPLNTVAIEIARRKRRPRRHPRARPADDCWFENDGQLTKAEIRALTLSAWRRGRANCCGTSARVPARSASNGACAIRATAHRRSRSAPSAQTERIGATRGTSARRISTIVRRTRAGGPLPICRRRMPSSSAAEPSEAGVFEAAWAALKSGGRLVANAVTLETETLSRRALRAAMAAPCDASRSRVSSRSAACTAGGPAMPVTQWVVTKP